MKKAIILLISLILVLYGCNNQSKVDKNREINDGNYSVEISSNLERYTQIMSSVPGLPINIKCNYTGDDDKAKLIGTCSNGEFIRWQQDGTIVVEGDRIQNTFKDITIYWSPLKIKKDDTLTSIKFAVYKDGVILQEIEGEIVRNNEGYYHFELSKK